MDTVSVATRLGLTAFIWAVWCVMHSLLNSQGISRSEWFLQSGTLRYHRLFYNLTAVSTLLLALHVTPQQNEILLWAWDGLLRLIPPSVWILAVIMLALSLMAIDVWDFLGLKVFGLGAQRKAAEELVTTGIYGVIRHPQLCAALLIFWFRDITDTNLVINAVLTVYALVGARREEARLIAVHGEAYKRYRQEVPAFIPFRAILNYQLYLPIVCPLYSNF